MIVPTVYSVGMFCMILLRGHKSERARLKGEKKMICQAVGASVVNMAFFDTFIVNRTLDDESRDDHFVVPTSEIRI